MGIMTAAAPFADSKALMFFDKRLTRRIMTLATEGLLWLGQEVRLIAGMGEVAQRAALCQSGMDILTAKRFPVMAAKAQILPRLGQQSLVRAVVGGMTDKALALGKGLMNRQLVALLALGLMTGQAQCRCLTPQLNAANQPMREVTGNAVAVRHRSMDNATRKLGPHLLMAVKAPLPWLP